MSHWERGYISAPSQISELYGLALDIDHWSCFGPSSPRWILDNIDEILLGDVDG